MLVLIDMEISCKGHCEKLSHFLDHVSHTVLCPSIYLENYCKSSQYLSTFERNYKGLFLISLG